MGWGWQCFGEIDFNGKLEIYSVETYNCAFGVIKKLGTIWKDMVIRQSWNKPNHGKSAVLIYLTLSSDVVEWKFKKTTRTRILYTINDIYVCR